MQVPPNLAEKLGFMKDLMMDTAHAPSKEFLKIPDRLPAEWATFFDFLVRYCATSCGDPPGNPCMPERIRWEKRQWMMEDDGLDEFDMLASAIKLKDEVRINARSASI